MNIEIAKENLSHNGFRVRHFATAAQARDAALELIPVGSTVGVAFRIRRSGVVCDSDILF